MASFTASLADVVMASRMDAEYYQPEFVESQATLARANVVPLPSLVRVSDGNHLSISHAFTPNGEGNFRYLRGQDVGQFFLGEKKPIFIPGEEYARLERSHIHPGDVLLSIVGTVGSLSLVPEASPPMTGSCKLAILRPIGSASPEYIAAFLASEFGQSQIRRLTRGAVQMGLILADMKHVLVPRLGELEVEVTDEVATAYKDLRSAHDSLKCALEWLPEQWGFKASEELNENAFSATLSAIQTAHRYDAEYFRPEYSRHRSRVLGLSSGRATGLIPVGRLLTKLTNGHTPTNHDLSVGDVTFLTAENVVDYRVDYNASKRVTNDQHATELASTRLTDGDILFTIKGRVGDVAPLSAPPPGECNINQDVAVLRLVHDVDPFFFAAWFNSSLGRPFLNQAVTGAINPFLGLNTLARLPFPEVDPGYQREAGAEIQRLVATALRNEEEATNRLNGAIARITKALQKPPRVLGLG